MEYVIDIILICWSLEFLTPDALSFIFIVSF